MTSTDRIIMFVLIVAAIVGAITALNMAINNPWSY